MTPINDIFRTFGPEYLERYSQVMPKAHRKVIEAIIACRTEVYGMPFISAKHVEPSIRSIAPVEIAIALLVSTIRPGSGWRNN